MLQRDFRVVSKALKGKGRDPTIILENGDGEKLTLKLEDEVHLKSFEINQAFTVKLVKAEQQHIQPFVQPEPQITEATATVPEGVEEEKTELEAPVQ
jgi:hypothetical protein